jgi:hypothetical protein
MEKGLFDEKHDGPQSLADHHASGGGLGMSCGMLLIWIRNLEVACGSKAVG